jgi:GTPase SAR1 family protein
MIPHKYYLKLLKRDTFKYWLCLSIVLPICLSAYLPAQGQTTLSALPEQDWGKIVTSLSAILAGLLAILVGYLTYRTACLNHEKASLELQIQKEKKEAEERLKQISLKAEKQLKETEEQLQKKLFSSEFLKSDERRNAVIIAGIGGSGKTTLINRLSSDSNIDPHIATGVYKMHSFKEQHNNVTYNYYVVDSMGQNIGSLISGLMIEQKKFNSPMTFGVINSIIFLVDVAKKIDSGKTVSVQQVLDGLDVRIDQHLSEWSDTALDAVFGLTRTSYEGENALKYVCLFINKIDLLQYQTQIVESEVMQKYQSLISKIESRCREVRFSVICGSLEKRHGLPELQDKLREYSWPEPYPKNT